METDHNSERMLENALNSLRPDLGKLGFCENRSHDFRHNRRIILSRIRSAVCRTSVLACAFIICVHLFLVYTVDVGPTIDRIARQQASIVLPGGVNQQSVPVSDRHRPRRELFDGDAPVETPVEDARDSRSTLSHLSKSDEGSSKEGEGVDPSLTASISTISLCRSGHIQGFNSVCEAQPCLRRLRGNATPSSQPPVGAIQSDLISPQVLRKISRISGHLDTVHYTIVPFITRFQWANEIYGSVGEFGVSLGKFTSLLSTYTDVEAGERLFASDCFNRSSTYSSEELPIVGLSPIQIFTTHMRDFGFDETSTGPRKLHLYRGSSKTIDRNIFASWDLPQFRLISVDTDLDRLSLFSDLEVAACLLRDGGVIVVNGIDHSESRPMTTSTLASFFGKHGNSSLSPIISAGNKLYLTTTNWRRKYVEAVTNDVVLQHSGLIQSEVMEYLNTEHLTLTSNTK